MNKKYYCLVSISRSGSTALEKVLSLHDDIYHDFTRLSHVEDKTNWIRNFACLHEDKKESCIGFKCLLGQYDDIESEILSNEKFCKIVLFRKNIFQWILSKGIALHVKNWHTKINYNDISPFVIDEKWFYNHMIQIKNTQVQWMQYLNNYKIFYYEDLFLNNGTYKSVLDYLNIDDKIKEYTLEKINDYKNVKNIIRNISSLEKIYEDY